MNIRVKVIHVEKTSKQSVTLDLDDQITLARFAETVHAEFGIEPNKLQSKQAVACVE
jgi:hypothetical protein